MTCGNSHEAGDLGLLIDDLDQLPEDAVELGVFGREGGDEVWEALAEAFLDPLLDGRDEQLLGAEVVHQGLLGDADPPRDGRDGRGSPRRKLIVPDQVAVGSPADPPVAVRDGFLPPLPSMRRRTRAGESAA